MGEEEEGKAGTVNLGYSIYMGTGFWYDGWNIENLVKLHIEKM